MIAVTRIVKRRDTNVAARLGIDLLASASRDADHQTSSRAMLCEETGITTYLTDVPPPTRKSGTDRTGGFVARGLLRRGDC
jgi:hypothetical protein